MLLTVSELIEISRHSTIFSSASPSVEDDNRGAGDAPPLRRLCRGREEQCHLHHRGRLPAQHRGAERGQPLQLARDQDPQPGQARRQEPRHDQGLHTGPLIIRTGSDV